MEKRANPISATVDYERDGLQHGFLRLPYSRDDSAWGAVMIPITVAKNGKGPTVLLTGANHGDEYEGPVALMNLAASIDASVLSGRVIIVPTMNYPAFRSATRTSPIDKGNLNRVFPGKPDGTVTEKIADYFQRTLLPLADVVLDIHSGGKTLEFVPFCCAHRLPDRDHQAQCVAAMKAFNAPYSMMLLEIDNVGMYDTAAEEMGKVFISTELGGGGTTSAKTVAIAKRGVRNLLIHAGILAGKIETESSTMLDMPSGECFTFSEQDGLLEPNIDLAQPVRKGDVIAQVWPAHRTGAPPTQYRAAMDGILAGRHFPGLVKSGDCIAVTAQVVS
ncbi:N(2)-acetyl-L-2,4-diaminobutanoate deacetylase DoeB [Dongia deserti]|uniref:N(2)-acetyl-L-2,4-diaminobutanoate deacetylase DoeB n=1 Tax=Dongia deserti TaxID=2268030 RepID=UPI000E6478D8|nr:N(2)-acetyl-L-2,4-diaminobutanoate deacetylase DoeB [Dongia deserti]